MKRSYEFSKEICFGDCLVVESFPSLALVGFWSTHNVVNTFCIDASETGLRKDVKMSNIKTSLSN